MSDYRTLVTPNELAELLGDPSSDVRVLDCRFSLADPHAGRRAYEQGHVPGAIYADLERDLSSPAVPGVTGRHPLPDPAALASQLGRWGIDSRSQVVAYDDVGGAMAARAWWLLRWLGHDRVAVLDGGFPAWQRAGHPTDVGVPSMEPRNFEARLRPSATVSADDVARMAPSNEHRVFDARASARFRGEEEPIDPIAGHIPGARSLPLSDNLEDGYFRESHALRAHFDAALGHTPPERCAVYCGSGVTACHVILAATHAGLDGIRLYPGSWSEWITDPSRGVARGET